MNNIPQWAKDAAEEIYRDADTRDDLVRIITKHAPAIYTLDDNDPHDAAFKDILQQLNDKSWQQVRELVLAAREAHSIASGSGRCSAVPCFDAEDYEVESRRVGWVVVDKTAYDHLRRALEAFKEIQ